MQRLKARYMQLRLRFKLLLLNSLIYGATLLIAGVFWLVDSHRSNQDSFDHRIGIQATVVAGNLNAALIFMDIETIEEVLNTLEVDSAILSAMVKKTDGTVVSWQSYRREEFTPQYHMSLFFDNELQKSTTKIRFEDKVVGMLVIEASNAEVLNATGNAVVAALLVLMGALLFTALLSERGLRWMLGPVEQLSRLASEVKDSKNYSLRANVQHADEVGELADEFNAMLEMIEQRDQFLEKEVGQRTAELAHQATHDVLTQLPNRRGLQQYVQDILQYSSPEKQYALLALDLDQFKVVNDTCGHIGGDQLLKSIARLLESGIAKNDYLARLGGDEFAIVLGNADNQSMFEKSEEIRKQIEDFVFVWEGLSFNMHVSIGALLFKANDMDMQSLFRRADAACFAAKDLGKNRTYAIAEEDQGMSERHAEMALVREINSALVNDDFLLYRQPIKALNPNSNNPDHYEILLRLKRDGFEELTAPDEFLPAAVRFGLSTHIDLWVVSNLIDRMQGTHNRNVYKKDQKQPVYWVNLSTTSLKDANFIDFLTTMLKETKLPTESLIFEITETGFIDSLDLAAKHMHSIRNLGFKFALDDFGSGASSFKCLKELPLDYLKIDGSFIRNLKKNATDLIVTRSIIEIASSMSLQIVVEHVEDEETLQLVKELGVDYAQGWALGYPQVLDCEKLIQTTVNS